MGNFYKSAPSKFFTKLPNELIRNSKISDGTFRFICWVSSHSEGFKITFQTIKSALGYGRDKMRAIIAEAEQNNYLVRVRLRNDKGQIDWDYYVFCDKEDCEEFKRENLLSIDPGVGKPPVGQPSVVEPPVGQPSVADPPLIRKNNIEDQKKEDQKREGAPLLSQQAREILIQESHTNIPQEPITDISQIEVLEPITQSREIAPALNYAEIYQDKLNQGYVLTKLELITWAKYTPLGEVAKFYRRSGVIFTGGGIDIDSDFALFVAQQNCRKPNEATIALGLNVIRSCEADPTRWQNLISWVAEWKGNTTFSHEAAKREQPQAQQYSFKLY